MLRRTYRMFSESPRRARELARAQRQTGAISTEVRSVVKKSVDYSVVLAGGALFTVIAVALAKELFSGDSANSLYSKSFEIVREDAEVIMILGEPVKGFDESRGRGMNLDSEEGVDENGKKFIRVQYPISGPRGRAKIVAEVRNCFD